MQAALHDAVSREMNHTTQYDHGVPSFAGMPTSAGLGDARQRTKSPIVTGTSVLGIKYADGVMMIADTLGSYGSLARFKNMQRLHAVSDNTLLGVSGEMSDFQFIKNLLQQQTIQEFTYDDGCKLEANEIHSYLSRVLYNRRTKVDPLWNQILTAGIVDDKPFLGYVDLYGSNYEEDIVTTGYGLYMAAPLLRKAWRPDLTEAEARKMLEDSARVLYYRDCRTINRFTLGTVTAAGVTISEPFELETKWDYKKFVDPTAN